MDDEYREFAELLKRHDPGAIAQMRALNEYQRARGPLRAYKARQSANKAMAITILVVGLVAIFALYIMLEKPMLIQLFM